MKMPQLTEDQMVEELAEIQRLARVMLKAKGHSDETTAITTVVKKLSTLARMSDFV